MPKWALLSMKACYCRLYPVSTVRCLLMFGLGGV
jgi:hypothetical protein